MRIVSCLGCRVKYDIVIAGGGFAGAYAARALAKVLGPEEARRRVALVAEQNVLVFQPMLAEVAGSSLSPIDVVNPLRDFCRGVTVLQGRVTAIDWENRELELDGGRFTRDHRLGFGQLGLCLGSVTDLSRVPGMSEYGRPLKNVTDALRVRAAVINRMEEANLVEDEELRRRLLTFVVVGGGYTGVETAGQIFDLIHNVQRFYNRTHPDELKVVLVHSRNALLNDIGVELGDYACDALRARGLDIRLNTRVVEATASRVVLENGESIEAHTLISTIGNAPNPVIARLADELGAERDRGRMKVEPTLQVPGAEGLWAAGDCALVPWNDRGTPKNAPPTAQFAMRQGTLLGQNLAASLTGGRAKPFEFYYLGQLASIGSHEAVAEILGFRFKGFLAWWMWRTIYLSKLPSFKRKLRVVVDWTFDLLFARDVSLVLPPPDDVLRAIHLEEGEELFDAGDPCRGVYYVRTGEVVLTWEDGSERNYPAGDIIHREALDDRGCWRGRTHAKVSTDIVVFRELALKLLQEELELRPRREQD